MKKILFLPMALLLTLVSCTTTDNTSVVTKTRNIDKKGNYSITLDSSNSYSGEELKNSFKHFDVLAEAGSYAKINRGGYITNTEDFNDIDSFTISYKIVEESDINKKPEVGFGSLYYTTDDYYIDNPFSYERIDINSDNHEKTIELDDNPAYISFYTTNTVIIDKIVINYNYDTLKTYSDDFTFKVIGTNDIHGRVNTDGTYTSLAHVTSYIDDVKKNNKYNLILDQGDLYQGSLDQYATNGKVMEDYLLINGYDSTILGNHEWDNGDTKIIEHVAHNKVSLLACNVRRTDGSVPEFVAPYKVVERHGVKIGLIGAIGDCKSSISASSIEGYDFLVGNELTNEIIKNSNELKKLGCEYIILQLHDGAESNLNSPSSLGYYDVSRLSGSYVDLALEGHTHKIYNFKDSNGVYHLQGAGYLGSIYSIDINVKKENDVNKFTYGSFNIIRDSEINRRFNDDNIMGDVNDWYHENVYGPVGDRVATTLTRRYTSDDLRKLMAQIYYNIGKDDGYRISYGGGFLSVRAPYELKAGEVTYSDLANLFPFDNTIYLCKISGRNLKRNFINSSNSNYYGYYDKNYVFLDNETYYIVTDSYNTDYWNYRDDKSVALEIVKSYTGITSKYARDYLFDYFLKNNG